VGDTRQNSTSIEAQQNADLPPYSDMDPSCTVLLPECLGVLLMNSIPKMSRSDTLLHRYRCLGIEKKNAMISGSNTFFQKSWSFSPSGLVGTLQRFTYHENGSKTTSRSFRLSVHRRIFSGFRDKVYQDTVDDDQMDHGESSELLLFCCRQLLQRLNLRPSL